MPLVSIIIPAKNEGKHVQNTIDSAFQVKTNYPFEIIVVDDGSTDGCCHFLKSHEYCDRINLIQSTGVGAAMARNLGADHSKGNYLIFCDAHLFFEDLWIDRLIKPIRNGHADATNPGIADVANPNNVGYGYRWVENLEPRWNPWKPASFASPHLAGGCLAIARDVFFNIGGFERGFRVWGREDEEISLKLWLFGYQCCVLPDIKVYHVFRSETQPFPLTWDDINYNLLRMAYSHFNEERIEKCRKLIQYSNPSEIESLVLLSDVLEQRSKYFSRRIYDDDWYMNKFEIPF